MEKNPSWDSWLGITRQDRLLCIDLGNSFNIVCQKLSKTIRKNKTISYRSLFRLSRSRIHTRSYHRCMGISSRSEIRNPIGSEMGHTPIGAWLLVHFYNVRPKYHRLYFWGSLSIGPDRFWILDFFSSSFIISFLNRLNYELNYRKALLHTDIGSHSSISTAHRVLEKLEL